MQILLFIVFTLVLILCGLPIAFALGGVGILSIFLWLGPNALQIATLVGWNSVTDFTIIAVPLFILMGFILSETGLSSIIYQGLYPVLSKIMPAGGLLHSNIAFGAVFAACSGSSIASAATIGTMALPQMEKRGYETGISLGSVAAGGTLGILIPPSLILIVYGAMVNASIGKLFLAGILPGIILALCYIIYIVIRLKINPAMGPDDKTINLSWGYCFKTLLNLIPIIILIAAVLGSIYGGWATPSEASAIGCVLSLIIAICYRKVNWKVIKTCFTKAVETSCMILLIYMGAKIMTIALANLGIPSQIARTIASLGVPNLVILGCIIVLYLILGMLMDGMAMVVMTAPIIYPIITSMGYDVIWFGIIITLLVECSLLTPPVGMNLFILRGLRPNIPFSTIVRGSFPFFLIILGNVIFYIIFPKIILWIPMMSSV